MTLQEFNEAVEKIVREARDAGLEDDDLASELHTIAEGLTP